MDGQETSEEGQEEKGSEERKEEVRTPEPNSAYATANIDPNDPNAPKWDDANQQWLDPKTNLPLRDQNPGIPTNSYVGRGDVPTE